MKSVRTKTCGAKAEQVGDPLVFLTHPIRTLTSSPTPFGIIYRPSKMFWPPVSEAVAHDMGWPWKEVEDANPSEYWIHQGASEWPENHRSHIDWSKVYNPQIFFPRWRSWWHFEAKAIEYAMLGEAEGWAGAGPAAEHFWGFNKVSCWPAIFHGTMIIGERVVFSHECYRDGPLLVIKWRYRYLYTWPKTDG